MYEPYLSYLVESESRMVFKSIFDVAGDTARTPLALEPEKYKSY